MTQNNHNQRWDLMFKESFPVPSLEVLLKTPSIPSIAFGLQLGLYHCDGLLECRFCEPSHHKGMLISIDHKLHNHSVS